MSDPVLHLLDPQNTIRATSGAVRRMAVREFPSASRLAAQLQREPWPALVVADLSSGPPEDWAGTFEHRSRLNPILLVATADAGAGQDWLRRGAIDFVVVPERLPELNTRIERLLRLHQEFSEIRRGLHISGGCPDHLLHDLKNSLNAIFGYCQLLLHEPVVQSTEVKNDLKCVIRNAHAILEICDQLASESSNEALEDSYSGRTP